MKKITTMLSLLALLTVSCKQKEELTLVVGTYTDQSTSNGIYTYRFNQETGEATALDSATLENPSFLTFGAKRENIYAVSEMTRETAKLSAYQLEAATGKLHRINTQPIAGDHPCNVRAIEGLAVTANYSSGSISTFPLKEDGSILPATNTLSFTKTGADSIRQASSHLHCAIFSPQQDFLLATDLGGDCIYSYQVKREGNRVQLEKESLQTTQLPAGTGPRHLIFSTSGKRVYLISELSGEVMTFRYKNGSLQLMQTLVADSVGARGSGDIHCSPDNKFLYTSHRLQADGLSIFKIKKDGTLEKTGYQPTGKHPRNFTITPNGELLLVACRDENAIEIYRRNKKTGELTLLPTSIKLGKPVCLQFK
ncbi:MAG: lactonase family protein [Bacteroidaceae bacterium]|nr:lactonase family protein [Bacteroidaceae bacterium]